MRAVLFKRFKAFRKLYGDTVLNRAVVIALDFLSFLSPLCFVYGKNFFKLLNAELLAFANFVVKVGKVNVLSLGNVADSRFVGVYRAVATLQYPFEHAHIVAEAGPHKVAVFVRSEPVYVENLGRVFNYLAHIYPVLEVVAHMIARERLHCHRVVAEHAYRARSRRSRFRRHCRAYEHAVVPISRLVYEGSGGSPSSAEYDCVEGHAFLGIERGRNAGAILCGRRKARIGVSRVGRLVFLVELSGRPGFARPIYAVLGQILVEPFPPNCHIVGVKRNVGKNRAALGCRQSVGVGVFVGAGGYAEEAVFGVYGVEFAVFAHAYPGDIVAHALDFISLFKVVLGGDKHCEVGLSASGGESRRHVFLFAVGEGYAQNKHMFRHPALVFAEVRSNAQSKALFAEKNVAAVSRVYGNNRVIFGEVHNVSVFRVYVALCVEALNKVAVLAQSV